MELSYSTPTVNGAAGDATLDGSSSEWETHSYSTDSDRTFVLPDEDTSFAESDSYMTAQTLGGNSGDKECGAESLLEELRDLRSATPLKEMSGQLERWISTGLYTPSNSGNNSRASTPSGVSRDLDAHC